MAIKIDMLRVFRAVAETGSLAHASEQLSRTPSALSMMLKQLEDHIGAALFETQRKTHLTPMGRHILSEAQAELDHFDQTVWRIEQLAKAKSGLIRLAVTPSVAQVLLPPVLKQFNADYPGVLIELRDIDSNTVLQELVNDRADIAIATLPERTGFERTLLFSDAFGVVCRRDHHLVTEWDSLRWEDLQGEQLLSNGLCAFIQDPDFAPILASAQMMVHNTASLLALVRNGQGLTVLPKLVVMPDDPDLVFLPLKESTALRQVHVMHRPSNALMPLIRAFLERLEAEPTP